MTTAVPVVHTVARWSSGYRTWNSNSGTRVRIPGRATIPLGSNLGKASFTHTASPVSQLKETGVLESYTKGSFSAPEWL